MIKSHGALAFTTNYAPATSHSQNSLNQLETKVCIRSGPKLARHFHGGTGSLIQTLLPQSDKFPIDGRENWTSISDEIGEKGGINLSNVTRGKERERERERESEREKGITSRNEIKFNFPNVVQQQTRSATWIFVYSRRRGFIRTIEFQKDGVRREWASRRFSESRVV